MAAQVCFDLSMWRVNRPRACVSEYKQGLMAYSTQQWVCNKMQFYLPELAGLNSFRFNSCEMQGRTQFMSGVWGHLQARHSSCNQRCTREYYMTIIVNIPDYHCQYYITIIINFSWWSFSILCDVHCKILDDYYCQLYMTILITII